MRRLALLFLVLLTASPAAAQHPLLATTVQTTDTSVNSVLVGCTVGSTTCTGGIKAGPVTGTVFTGSGTSSFGSVATTSAVSVGGTLGVTGITTLSTARIGSAGAPSTFNGKLDIYNNAGFTATEFYDSSAGSDAKYWQQVLSGGSFIVRMVNDASSSTFDPFTIGRSGITGATITTNAALVTSAIITPTALGAGTTQNYNPTGLATAHVLRLSAGAGFALGGITAQTNGRQLKICNVDAATTLNISTEDASSTAANRFLASSVTGGTNIPTGSCMDFLYDGLAASGVGRWVGSWGAKQ
jgi:hypothetical protein